MNFFYDFIFQIFFDETRMNKTFSKKTFFFFYVFLSSISSSMNRFSAMPGNDNDPDRKPWWVWVLLFSYYFKIDFPFSFRQPFFIIFFSFLRFVFIGCFAFLSFLCYLTLDTKTFLLIHYELKVFFWLSPNFLSFLFFRCSFLDVLNM